MSRGRMKKPIKLHMAEGNPSHLTKAEIEERTEQELRVPFVDVRPPEYLNETQQEKFVEISEKLVDLGIMTELDIDVLARYVISQDLYLEYTQHLNEALKVGDITILKDLQNMQDKAFKQAQSSARDLGLTITSRTKIVVPTPPENEDDEL